MREQGNGEQAMGERGMGEQGMGEQGMGKTIFKIGNGNGGMREWRNAGTGECGNVG